MINLNNGVFLSGGTAVVENNNTLTIVDPGCHGGKEAIIDILRYSKSVQKPVNYAVISHAHGDHISYLKIFTEVFPKLKIILQINSPLKEAANILVQADSSTTLDGRKYRFIPTPGHSEAKDDLSIIVPDAQTLICGDLWQPQGKAYERADGVSAFPFYYHGDAYMRSLTWLINEILKKPLSYVLTGHGNLLSGEEAASGFHTTQQVVQRTKELSDQLIKEHSQKNPDEICEWIYDTICYERKFDGKSRKGADSDYESYDKPGIAYWVSKLMPKTNLLAN